MSEGRAPSRAATSGLFVRARGSCGKTRACDGSGDQDAFAGAIVDGVGAQSGASAAADHDADLRAGDLRIVDLHARNR